MRKFLTAAVLRDARSEGVDQLIWDSKVAGFAVRATPKGALTYFAIYRNAAGRQHRFKIGRAERIGLSAARTKAREILAQAELGADPAQDQRNARAGGETVESAFEIYFRSEAHTSRKSAKAIEAALRRDALPALGKIGLKDLTGDDVRRFRDAKALVSKVAANRSLSYLKAFLAWAVDDGRIPVNPAGGIKKPAKEKPRERYLSNAEVPAFWRACGRNEKPLVQAPYGSLFRFLLLTGQRLREAGEMKWSEVDMTAGVWRIPAARTKTDSEAIVPLSRQALAILMALPRFNNGPGFVFTATGDAPVQNFGRARTALWEAFLAEMKADSADSKALEKFTPHDLRRTARTGFAALGVPREVAEAVMNHQIGGNAIERTYDRHRREPEMRGALQKWADRIDMLCAPEVENVVPIRRVADE